jgi:hypothetical protein
MVPDANAFDPMLSAGLETQPEDIMDIIAASLCYLHDIDEAAYRRTITLFMQTLEAELTEHSEALSIRSGKALTRLSLHRLE